ncbi:MAG: hypothetical protein IPM29_25395 [Planctomycetes bacterium]|nr:hypothetical protein [Planctomycetota bacterium]
MPRLAAPIALVAAALAAPAPAQLDAPITVARNAAGAYEVRDGVGLVATFAIPSIGAVGPRVAVDHEPLDWVRVGVVWDLGQPVAIDELAIPLNLALVPDFHWVQHLSPVPGSIAAQQVWRSPAVIAAQGARQLAIVPDLDFVGRAPGGPWFLDYDAPARRITLGMSDYAVPAHVLFQKVPGMRVGPGAVTLAFRLHVSDDGGRHGDPFGAVTKLLWDRYAEPLWQAGEPRGTALDRYALEGYGWLDRWPGRAWHEFHLNGQRVGGVQQILDLTWSPNWRPAPFPLRWEIWNQAWFSSLRSGLGMYRWGQSLGQPDLIDRAKAIKSLALSAPQRDGLFPSVFVVDMQGRSRGAPPLAADWEQGGWTGSDRTPFERGIGRDWYHLVDCSTTAAWMLRWFREVEQDPALLAYVGRYVDGVLELQQADGFFPTWVDPITLQPSALLDDSPATSLTAGLLLDWATLSGDDRAPRAALRALDAVLADPVPVGRWEDFETYWSDSDLGRLTNVGQRFARNGVFKQNTLCMFWTAEALLKAFRATRDARYLGAGRRVLDELSMWQQVWQPPFMPVPTLGGFGVMNADGEWNDARQSMFAELYLDYYLEFGEPELFQRGVTALRCAHTLHYGPSNPDLQPMWEQVYPFLGLADYGFANENHAHFGRSMPAGTGLVYFTIFDWGAGAAAEAASRILTRFGQVYVDRNRGHAFGIDAIDAQWTTGGIRLRSIAHPDIGVRTVRVVFEDGSDQRVIVR